MAVYVNTNVSSLSGQRYLNNATNSLTTTYQRLSSGLRINSAKDDAAGLQISDRLTSQINGLNQGNRNANDGIAFAQTVEGALDEITSMFQKVRTLAVQANNGTNTVEDKRALSKEMSALFTEVERIAAQTTYGGAKVLYGNHSKSIYNNAKQDGTDAGQITFQVGANSGDTIDMSIVNYQITKLLETAGIDKDHIDNQKAGTDKLFNFKDGQVNISLTHAAAAAGGGAKSNGTISELIDYMDKLIANVDGTRASLGAMQNRLESSIRNQSNTSANEADARSRIRDADFAEESANLSQQTIIQQAATSMLMQANTRPQLGLSLLG